MIQIDMPMPTNCLDCPACNEYLMCAIPVNGRKWGENDVREFGQGRPEWCPMKEQEGYVSVPFSWLVKFCTHIDFKEPMSDSEREQKWKKKLNQQFGIVI